MVALPSPTGIATDLLTRTTLALLDSKTTPSVTGPTHWPCAWRSTTIACRALGPRSTIACGRMANVSPAATDGPAGPGEARLMGARIPCRASTATRPKVQPRQTVASTVRSNVGVQIIEVLPFGKLLRREEARLRRVKTTR